MLWIIIFPFVIDIKCVNANNSSYDQAYHTVKKTWKAASDECGSFGLEFEENVLKNIDALLGKEFWIGMAIYSVTTPWIEILAEASTKEPLYCLAGSFTENNDKRELSITRRVCNDQLQFTCRIGTASSTTPSQRLIAVGKPEKGSSTSFHTGAVIGGILGAFAMVAVLAVLIVRKLRSKGIFTESNTHDYDDTSRVKFSKTTYEDLEKTNHKSLTATTNQTCDVDESSAPIYEEVQK
ncbi:unnamed protein product [Mytilus coruscus]|uniref:C-type lectin domain-containing protein n=1 Tax=Mytilus coruscus TaxID=42192 RepID=A0A6J8CPB2_MYTCO|nr:unnamed protein product [Mytilus coruscus]